jgi:hypothetical protein
MGIGESVKKGFSISKQSMGLVMALFVFGFVWNLISLFYGPQPGAAETPAVSPILIVAGIVFILLTIFVQAGSLGYVRDKIKKGSAGMAEFMSAGGKYYLRLLLIGLVVALVIGVFVLLAAIVVSVLGAKMNVLAIILAIVLASFGIYFVILLFLAPYVAVADEQGVIASIKQSVAKVRKNILALLGISLILIAIGFGIGLLLGAGFAGLSLVIKGMPAQILFALLSSFVNAYLGLVVTGSFMSFYLALPSNTPPAE